MRNKILFIIFALFSAVSLGRSQSALSWQFDSTAFVVQPTDQILLTGTIFNSSSTPFVIQGGGASFTGDLQYTYGVTWLINLFEATVPANGSLQFDFCELIPIAGPVPLGVYVADPVSNPAAIDFTGTSLIPSQNYFQITVVPEPSTICVCGVGLVCFSGFRKRGIINHNRL